MNQQVALNISFSNIDKEKNGLILIDFIASELHCYNLKPKKPVV
jgi:hypothetical protein